MRQGGASARSTCLFDEDQARARRACYDCGANLQLSCRQAMNAPLPPVVFRPRSCPFPTPAAPPAVPVALPARLGGVAVVVGGRAQNAPDFERRRSTNSASKPRDAVTRLQQRIAARELAFRGDEKAGCSRRCCRNWACPPRARRSCFRKPACNAGGSARSGRARSLFFGYGLRRLGGPAGSSNWPRSIPSLAPCSFRSICRRCATAGTADRAGCRLPALPRWHVRAGRAGRVCPLGVSRRERRTAAALRLGGAWTIRSPFAERWGGWYVTGYHGPEHHRGNVLRRRDERALCSSRRPAADELSDFFPTADYLARRATSWRCIVLEHHDGDANALTRAGFACRRMIEYQHSLQQTFKEP